MNQIKMTEAEATEMTLTEYSYATDSASGAIMAESLQAAYDSVRATITPAMVTDGATLWVESATGERITMGIDRA